MKAVAVFPRSRETKVIEQKEPEISQPDEVMLRMLDVGICGTDWEICTFEYGMPPPGEDHLVIGHEALAEVVATGSAVENLRGGDLVVPSVRRPCLHPGCLACRSGHQDYCYTGDFTERGIKEAHGFMTEYVVERERYLHLVPPGLREFAVLTEPLTIAEKALAQVTWMMRQRPPWLEPKTPAEERGGGLSALVLGVGPVGLLGAMAMATAGFALEALRWLGTNGIFVLTGVPGLQAFVEADPASLMRDMVLKNRVLLGTVNAGPDDFAAALRNLDAHRNSWPEAVQTLIAGRYPPERAAELILGRPTGIKTVIAFDS